MGELFNNIITQLKETNKFNWYSVWNNQIERMINSESYAIMNPSVYVELETQDQHQLLENYQGYDINVNIHIVAEELDAGDGNIDEFISVYTLRDEVVKKLNFFRINQGGFLTKISEIQDYNHSNLYHYIITYRAHYIDNTAVITPLTVTGTTLSPTVIISPLVTINKIN